jgi:deoxyribose-phosphate aldolase
MEAITSVEQIARLIDHAVLRPQQTDADLDAGVVIARRYGVACVYPKPYQATRTKQLLTGSGIKLGIAVGFPQGVNLTAVKLHEAGLAIEQGAQELDMVMNICALLSGNYRLAQDDAAAVVRLAREAGVLVKIIIETCYLDDAQKVTAAKISEQAGAAFVKTSTNCGPGGATTEDVRLLRAALGPNVGVKAAGYITTADQVLDLYAAGATRFGTGYTENILEQLRARLANEASAR